MNDANQPNSKNDKSNPQGFNFVLYSIVIAIAITMGLVLLYQSTTDEIQFADLLRLVQETQQDENGDLVEGATGEIVIQSANGSKWRVLSNLRNISVGANKVTGTARSVITEKIDDDGKPLVDSTAIIEEAANFHTNISGKDEPEKILMQTLSENNIKYRFMAAPSMWRNWLPMFVLSGMFILVFFLMLRRLGGAGSPMAFGRSRGKLYAQEDLGVSFDDAAGIEEAVDELREVVDFLKSPDKYQRLGGRIPKGVLLVGPPGTGKTLLAKAVAGEAGVPFYSLSGSDFVEMFVGVGAARVRDMFEQAVAKAPCIIFIDELDALGKTRGTSVVGGHDEREQTLNALLVEMDGFDSNSGVIVLAATNRPEMLDQALLRPGRFDRQVLVDRPDVAGREQILRVHVRNVKLDESVDLKEVAKISPGFAGADLSNLGQRSRTAGGPQRQIHCQHARVQRGRRTGDGRTRKEAADYERRREESRGLPRSGPCAGRLSAAKHRSGAQSLDHSPRPGGARIHHAAARRRPFLDDAKRTRQSHPSPAGRYGDGRDHLSRRLDRGPK